MTDDFPILAIEEINAQDSFQHLSNDEKLELILLVYELSRALYNSYLENHE